MRLIGHGDILTSTELGLYVQMVDYRQYKIDGETLLSLVVEKDIVDKAKIEIPVKAHIRVNNPIQGKQKHTSDHGKGSHPGIS